MAPKFGTSGLRGLVTELTPKLVRHYTEAFIRSCNTGAAIHVGQDLRPSSPEIARHVRATIQDMGLTAIDCGVLPTPALAFSAMGQGHGAIMITGSHIPADRNGIKFYTPSGEISKDDEAAILSALTPGADPFKADITIVHDSISPFVARYVSAFGPVLEGLKIGVYQHSSAARDILMDVLDQMGAETVALSRSDTFIPVDTEAVDPQTREMLAEWITDKGLDAVVSTDGDADRPMLAVAPGDIIPGDVLGALTAQYVGADTVCTPVSSNTMITQIDSFKDIRLTKIGSPYVIAAMEEAIAGNGLAKTVGYEANGGFLMGFEAQLPQSVLTPLMTRDCMLPILAPLALAQEKRTSLAELVATLPARFTAADRLQGIETAASKVFLKTMQSDPKARASFFQGMPSESSVDDTDGLRVTFEGGDIVHLRPSGNAPEFRCYAESATPEAAKDLVTKHLAKLQAQLA